jgi:predicted ferric reductase
MTLPMGLRILDLSAYLGLIALGAVVLNMLLGMLIALRYSPVRHWPHGKFNHFRLHIWIGYTAFVSAVLHPTLLLFNGKPAFRVRDLLYPIHSPSQPLENTLGALALYLLAVVVVTSYFRTRLGRRLWKAFHFVIYAAAIPLIFHSLLTDPELQNKVDWLDGGKIFVDFAIASLLVAAILRWRRAGNPL